MQVFNYVHAQALYLRFSAIYGDKFVKAYHDDKFKNVWYEEWVSGLIGVDVNLIKGALDHCKANLNWVPSIAEFREICERCSGIPNEEESFKCALKREFKHPVIYLSFIAIGDWDFRHEEQKELKRRFRTSYQHALEEWRNDPKNAQEMMQSYLNPKNKVTDQSNSNAGKRIGEYFMDEIRTTLGREPKYNNKDITEQEKENLRNILKKAKQMAPEKFNHDEYYDKICKERADEAMKLYRENQNKNRVNNDQSIERPKNSSRTKQFKDWYMD